MPGGYVGGGGDEAAAFTREIGNLWESIRELQKPGGSSRVGLVPAVVEQQAIDGGMIPFTFTWQGDLEVFDSSTESAPPQYNHSGRDLQIVTVFCGVGLAPTGSPAVIDLLLNGSTVLAPAASIPAGQKGALANVASTYWAQGAYLTPSILAIGSTTPGADLTLTVWAR